MTQSFKYAVLLLVVSFMLTITLTLYLQYSFDKDRSLAQHSSSLKEDKKWYWACFVCYIWFYLCGRTYIMKEKTMLSSAFHMLGFQKFPSHPPFGIMERLDLESRMLLSDCMRHVMRLANIKFGIAGMLASVSILVLYKWLNYIPIQLISTKSLLVIPFGCLFGVLCVATGVVYYTHLLFSYHEVMYLLNPYNFPKHNPKKKEDFFPSHTKQSKITLDQACLILGISHNTSWDEVKKAYKQKIARNHPDKVSHLSSEIRQKAKEETLKINKAFEFIQTQKQKGKF